MLDPVPKLLETEPDVSLEILEDVTRGPSSVTLLEARGEVPVEEGDKGGDPVGEERVDEVVVVGDPGRVDGVVLAACDDERRGTRASRGSAFIPSKDESSDRFAEVARSGLTLGDQPAPADTESIRIDAQALQERDVHIGHVVGVASFVPGAAIRDLAGDSAHVVPD